MSYLSNPFSSLLVGNMVCVSLLSGCAGYVCCPPNTKTVGVVRTTPAVVCAPAICSYVGPSQPGTASPIKFSAIGYGAPGSYTQYTPAQQKLMAMRAAQVDAYRSLAEQVQGFRLSGSTTVSAFTVQNDAIRTYVDSFIRGARVVSVTAIADGNFQANVELEITDQFKDCVVNSGGCTQRAPTVGCTAAGCTAPSATQFSY